MRTVTSRGLLKKLHLKPKVLARVTSVTPYLNSIMEPMSAISTDPFYYLESCPDPDARRVCDAYRDQGRPSLDILPFEAYCLAADADPQRMVGLITMATARWSQWKTNVEAHSRQPTIVRELADRAMDRDNPDTLSYMSLYLRGTQFLPSPRGAQTTINVQQNTAAPNALAAPPPEQTIRRLSERFNAMRTPAPPVLEAATEPALLTDTDDVTDNDV